MSMSLIASIKALGRKIDDSRLAIDKAVFHNKVAKAVGIAKIDDAVQKVAHNPVVVRVVGTVVGAVVSFFATPAAGLALKMATDKIIQNLQINDAKKRADMSTKLFNTVQQKLTELPYEQRVIVADAYTKYGDAAFKRPEIVTILNSVIQAGTADLMQSVSTAKGATPSQALVDANNAATVAPTVAVQQKSSLTPLLIPAVGLMLTVLSK